MATSMKSKVNPVLFMNINCNKQNIQNPVTCFAVYFDYFKTLTASNLSLTLE